MNDNHKEMISIGLTIAIVGMSIFIIHRFIPSLIWAGIITIATYPIYKLWHGFLAARDTLAAFTFTLIIGFIIFLPLMWMLTLLVQEVQYLVNYIQQLNQGGSQPPAFLLDIPWLGTEIQQYWQMHIGQVGGVKKVLSNFHVSLTPASYYLKKIGVSLAHRSVQLGFTLMSLFFFYRDAEKLIDQIDHVGEYCLGQRWARFAHQLPQALQSTVNGTIVVGLGVGVLMGICYALVSFPAPTLVGFLTALAAMIPFVVPIVFAVVALLLFSYGSLLGAIIVIAWGTLVMFVADHFVKPVLIGGAIKLPFLAVLFGILGGVETLGILGLFVGPIIMVLFMTLWQEPQHIRAS